MEIPTVEEIVQSIDAFLQRHAMTQSRFGGEATRNPNIVADMRKGHQPSLAVLHRLKSYMAAKDAELAGADHGVPSTQVEARHHG